jgi:hypothetical protein
LPRGAAKWERVGGKLIGVRIRAEEVGEDLLAERIICPTCDPPLGIEADGEGHKITAACYDTVSVKVIDDRTIEETDKRNGNIVGTSKMTVSSDGNTATVESTEIWALRRNSWWTPFSLGFRDLGLLASSRFDGFGSESSPPFMGIFGESWCPLLAR